uniref:Sulfhydryl oxidase n=1 Tax=Calcidiscus leptoporus TaxID=127549 RepID=A0A7S0JH49_9EUKA
MASKRRADLESTVHRCNGRHAGPCALALMLSTAFGLGALCSRLTISHSAVPASKNGAESQFELRGPPDKTELGNSGWTLLHTLAANFADVPSLREQRAVEVFMRALGELYPCKLCAAHLRAYMAANAVAADSRERLSLWMCEAHNDVNRRNGKETFFCDLGVLDHRWKDCGCNGKNSTH